MDIAPLSKLCQNFLEDRTLPQDLVERRFLEFMISCKHDGRPRKLFKATWLQIAIKFNKVHSNFLLFPEISDNGRFHYHACIEYDPANFLLYNDLKNWCATIGHTDRYSIDKGQHKETKPTDVAPCRCLFCRLEYMYKQQKQMKSILRHQCPIDHTMIAYAVQTIKDREQAKREKKQYKSLIDFVYKIKS